MPLPPPYCSSYCIQTHSSLLGGGVTRINSIVLLFAIRHASCFSVPLCHVASSSQCRAQLCTALPGNVFSATSSFTLFNYLLFAITTSRFVMWDPYHCRKDRRHQGPEISLDWQSFACCCTFATSVDPLIILLSWLLHRVGHTLGDYWMGGVRSFGVGMPKVLPLSLVFLVLDGGINPGSFNLVDLV